MAVQMIGVDYSKADITYREIFSFHLREVKDAMKQLMAQYELEGCVIISTCNRTEIYISAAETRDNLREMLCEIKGIEVVDCEAMTVMREGDEVVKHLFLLACGMKSRIFGEDQIISQVKMALEWARDVGATDVVLEKLFQMAITSAKRVKTQVHLTGVQTSVIENMIKVIKADKGSLEDKICLIIGNGEIGRLAARRLMEEGASVTMTLRQYKTKEVEIPVGCHVIAYQERYSYLKDFEVIISGTSSPHYTILYEEACECLQDGKKRILIDLAVPRDISSCMGNVEGIALYNIDDLGGISKEEINTQAVEVAMGIVGEYVEEFKAWQDFRKYVPLIQSVGHIAGLDVYKRVEKKMKRYVDTENQSEMEEAIRGASEKVVKAMLYGLKEYLAPNEWQDCLSAVENVVLKKDG